MESHWHAAAFMQPFTQGFFFTSERIYFGLVQAESDKHVEVFREVSSTEI